MSKISITRQIDDDPGMHHIPGQHNMQITLCGWVDVPYSESDAVDRPCNCASCADAWRKIKNLSFPGHYFDLPE